MLGHFYTRQQCKLEAWGSQKTAVLRKDAYYAVAPTM